MTHTSDISIFTLTATDVLPTLYKTLIITKSQFFILLLHFVKEMCLFYAGIQNMYSKHLTEVMWFTTRAGADVYC